MTKTAESGRRGGSPEVSPAERPAVAIDDLRVRFGEVDVLRGIDLDVAAGEVLVIAGPSGSGKSTLLRCVNGLVPAGSGTIRIEGERLPTEGRELAGMRARVGMVFQSFNLFAHRTLIDNVMLAPRVVLGVRPDEAREAAASLLDRVGLSAHAEKYPAQLSGGQQQRGAIARALAMHPRVLLFDEATSSLDPEMVNEVLAVMTDLAADGITMLVVTHEMDFARRVAHRVVFLDDGLVVESGPPDEFFDNPHSDRAREFLSAVVTH